MIWVDTGFWLALANPKDRHHERCREALKSVRRPLVTTWPVMTETCHLLLKRLGAHAQEAFVESARRGVFEIAPLDTSALARVEALMRKYRSLPMDLADASLVVLAESRESGEIFSTDRRDFRTYRWKNRKPFTNLLFPDD